MSVSRTTTQPDSTVVVDTLPTDPATDNHTTLYSSALGAIANAEAAVSNWATLTAAQKDNAAKLALALSARLARLVLNQTGTAGV